MNANNRQAAIATHAGSHKEKTPLMATSRDRARVMRTGPTWPSKEQHEQS